MKVIIVDYGMGNLRSVAKACEKVGLNAFVSSEPDSIASASALILPGVGAFQECVKNLQEKGLYQPILEYLKQNKRPFLGICLGLQLLFTESDEGGASPGFGVLQGKVKQFKGGLKIPHMGWNQLQKKKESPLFKDIPDESYLYFVHSYYVEPNDSNVIIGLTEYGSSFVSAVQMGNIYGTQFHPEKSQEVGLKILSNFAKICGEKTL